MFRVRGEGEKLIPGFNFMWRPHIQVFFVAAYGSEKLLAGLGFSRIKRSFYVKYERWKDDELR